MKIISASATIIEETLAALTIPERLEWCGRLCYDSHNKITSDSAEPFVEKTINREHNSVLEMASIGFHVDISKYKSSYVHLNLAKLPYLTHYVVESHKTILIYGSVRAFLEAFTISPNPIISACVENLCQEFPIFNKGYSFVNSGVVAHRCLSIHDHFRRVAVLFTVDRAISHELVRHRPASFLQQSQRYCAYRDHLSVIDPRNAYKSLAEEDNFQEWQHAMQFAETTYKELLNDGCSPQAARKTLPNSAATKLLVYTSLAHWKQVFDLRTTSACDPSMLEVMQPLEKDFIAKWPHIFSKGV